MINQETAFVGDIHGNLGALNGIVDLLINDPEVDRIVFLGDYINKGRESANVLARLLELSDAGVAAVLRGNHETAMLDALNTGDLAAFLKKGGASTIRSYVRRPVRSDVLKDFRSCVPDDHIRFLRGMGNVYETSDVIASHFPAPDDVRFRISAHIPVGMHPVIEKDAAYLDTDCGTPTGRLTAFRWPSRSFQQVDAAGHVIETDTR